MLVVSWRCLFGAESRRHVLCSAHGSALSRSEPAGFTTLESEGLGFRRGVGRWVVGAVPLASVFMRPLLPVAITSWCDLRAAHCRVQSNAIECSSRNGRWCFEDRAVPLARHQSMTTSDVASSNSLPPIDWTRTSVNWFRTRFLCRPAITTRWAREHQDADSLLHNDGDGLPALRTGETGSLQRCFIGH